MAILWTEDMTLRTYWCAMFATLSSRLLSKGNWKAMVNTDRMFGHDGASTAIWFVAGPGSRLEVRSKVRFVANESCVSDCKTIR